MCEEYKKELTKKVDRLKKVSAAILEAVAGVGYRSVVVTIRTSDADFSLEISIQEKEEDTPIESWYTMENGEFARLMMQGVREKIRDELDLWEGVLEGVIEDEKWDGENQRWRDE